MRAQPVIVHSFAAATLIGDAVDSAEVERKHYEDEISAGMWKNKSGEGEKAEVNLTIDKSGRLLEPGIVWEQLQMDDD